MKDETLIWLSYADENLDVAGLTLEHGHLNACLQKENRVGDRASRLWYNRHVQSQIAILVCFSGQVWYC